MSVRITRGRISLLRAYAELADVRAGAVVVFLGRVRPDRTASGRVRALDYEMHRPLTDHALRQIEQWARRRYAVRRILIWHRFGRVAVGEASVLVGVAASHRAPAFIAARAIMERVKRAVPIWKTSSTPRGRHRRPSRRRPAD